MLLFRDAIVQPNLIFKSERPSRSVGGKHNSANESKKRVTSILEEIRYFLSCVVFLVDQNLHSSPSLKDFAHCDFRD